MKEFLMFLADSNQLPSDWMSIVQEATTELPDSVKLLSNTTILIKTYMFLYYWLGPP